MSDSMSVCVSKSFDVAVVGAGPAGLSAAVHGAEQGLRVVLIDSNSQPGGQFWRHGEESEAASDGSGHHDWKRFADMRARLYKAESGGDVLYLRNTMVWLIETANGATTLRLSPTSDIHPASAPSAGTAPGAGTVPGTDKAPESTKSLDLVSANWAILCPGGYDRQLPIPGWDLPGVMAAGGVQALLKSSGTAVGKIAVVAGTGPFLLPVATGLAKAGVKVAAICEANSPTGWLRNLRGAIRAPEKALEGGEYAAQLVKHRISYKVRTAVTEIHGRERVESVTLSKLDADGDVVPKTGRRVACDVVALGWGFTPQLDLVLAAGGETDVDVDGSLIAVVDARLKTSVPGISVAGEATGVGGAAMAVLEGELAALDVALFIAGEAGEGRLAGPEAAALEKRIIALQRDRARLRAFAVAMHRANPVPVHWTSWLTPDTIVCRCEEVSYGTLCAAHAELGAADARSLKSFARPGMGWCQGRVCGYATSEIAADFAACGDEPQTSNREGSARGSFNGIPSGIPNSAKVERPEEPGGPAEPGCPAKVERQRASAPDLRSMAKRTLISPISLGTLADLECSRGPSAPTPAEPTSNFDDPSTSDEGLAT